MKSIHQIFQGNEHLMDLPPVEELIEYTQELEGNVFESDMTENKEQTFKSMLQEIMHSCQEYEENKILEERYPELYKKVDADTLVKNLLSYILEMNRVSFLGL
jgi:cell division ATPase FtsA